MAASAVMASSDRAGAIINSIPMTRLLFEEDFDRPLSFRTGGIGDHGLYRGSGLWTPNYYWAESAVSQSNKCNTGSTIGYGTTETEGAWFVDPTSPSIRETDYSPFGISQSCLRIITERRPATLDGKLPVNTATGKEYEWVSGLLSTRHSVYFKPPVYIEVRCKFPKGKALWGGVCLYGEETNGHYFFESPFEAKIPWSADKPAIEIDIAEYISEAKGPNFLHSVWH
jgi:hypothetical protein